jgi:beta-phosphoglucomutase-like phosphatase (HAD superfamily)
MPRFMELYSACATRSTRLVPHARDTLLHFYHAGVRQAICTNKPLGVTRLILDALDIAGFFQVVVGGDSTAEKKPHPLPLQTCLAELGVQAGDPMVGDWRCRRRLRQPAHVVLVPDGYTGVPADRSAQISGSRTCPAARPAGHGQRARGRLKGAAQSSGAA